MPPKKPVTFPQMANATDNKNVGGGSQQRINKYSIVSTKIKTLIRDGPETMIANTKNAKVTKKSSKESTSSGEQTFAVLQVLFKKQTKSLNERFQDLSEETVSNIMAYAKQLPRFPRSDYIDDSIFKAQMFHQFHLTDAALIDQMYYVTSKTDRNPKVTVENYAELICIFVTNIISVKVEFVFKVYNQRGDGELTKDDLRRLLAPMVDNLNSDENDDIEEGAALNYMVNLLLGTFDIDQSGSISVDEFQALVKKDRLMIQCLGTCLPEEKALASFKKKIVDRNPIEVGGLFRNERKRSLRHPDNCHLDDDVFTKLFPITLEMP